jgi:hypothetical protein
MKILLIIFILYGTFVSKTLSQENAKDDTLVIRNLLGDLEYLMDNNLDSAVILSQEIEQRAAKINYQRAVWEAQIGKGRVLYSLGYPDSSKILLEKVLKETQDKKCRLEEIESHSALAWALKNDYTVSTIARPRRIGSRSVSKNPGSTVSKL